MRYSLPVVPKLIAAPCEVPWSSMKGDDRKRHCAECDRDVHNLSAMTKEELQAFLHALVSSPENARLPCVSLYARPDGTVLTEDCPVGLRARRRRALLASTLGLGGVALAALTALALLSRGPASPKALWSDDPVGPPAPVTTLASTPVGTAPAVLAVRETGFVTIDGPPGTEVFEGSRFIGTAPVTFQTATGSHTYRASSSKGRGDDVFVLEISPDRHAIHTVRFPTPVTTTPTPTPTPTQRPGWHRTAGRMAPSVRHEMTL